MAQNKILPVATDWTLLTDSDVSTVTFQNVGSYSVVVSATAGIAAPPPTTDGITVLFGFGRENAALSELFGGVPGCNRLWARTEAGTGAVFVSHA